MPAETPEEATLRAKRIGVAVLGVGVLALAVVAGMAIWRSINGQPLGASGWFYIICFVCASIGFVPMARQVLHQPPEK